MNRISTIIFGILVVLLPMVPFSRPGIFSGQQAAYVAVIVCSVLLFFMLRVRQQKMRGMHVQISLSDTLVALYLAYGLINIAFLQGFRVDPHLYWKWGAVGLGYVVARNVKWRRMVLVALIIAGVAQSLIAIAQKLSLVKSNHSAFEVTGTFGNPGQLAGLLCAALIVALGLLITVWWQRETGLESVKSREEGLKQREAVPAASRQKESCQVARQQPGKGQYGGRHSGQSNNAQSGGRHNRRQNTSHSQTRKRQNFGSAHQTPARRPYSFSALLVATLLITVALLLADSRAALVGVIVGLIVWSWPAFSRFIRKHKVVMSVALVAVVVVAGIVLFRYKPGSANARLLVWRVGIEMASEKPIAGHGVASFHQEYMPRQAAYFESHPDSPWRLVADNAVYPYNEPLHLLMEQGIIGLLIMIAIFISVFSTISLRRRPQREDKAGSQVANPAKPADKQAKLAARQQAATSTPVHKLPRNSANASTVAANNHDRQVFKAALAALTIYSCFSYPSYIFGLLFLFPVLLGSLESGTVWEFRLPGWLSALGKVLIVVCIVQSMRLIDYYRESEKMVGRLFSGNPQMQQKAQQYVAANYGRLRYNPVFNNIYAVWIGDHHEAADRLPPEQIAGMDPFCEGYCTTGSYYARQGMFAEAERYCMAAVNMIPTRLMPNYLLWRLYAAQGDTARAAATARKALQQPLKVENDFTRAMKDEMRDYLTR